MNVNHTSIFPTIISTLTLPDYHTIKDPLIKWIYDYMNNNKGRIRSNVGGWQSNSNFYQQQSFTQYLDYIMYGVDTYSKGLGSYNYTISNMWINVNHKGSSNTLHCHPESLMSGVFYIDVPDDSGRIGFLDPNSFVNAQLHRTVDTKIKRSFNFTQVHSTVPHEGLMLLFPSYLSHYVDTNNSDHDRISIAFNLN